MSSGCVCPRIGSTPRVTDALCQDELANQTRRPAVLLHISMSGPPTRMGSIDRTPQSCFSKGRQGLLMTIRYADPQRMHARA